MGSENKSPFYQLSSSLVQEAVLCLFVRFARGCIGESASVYVAEKGIQSSFNMVLKNAKNHSKLIIINIPLWAHEMNLRVMSVSLIKIISNQVYIKKNYSYCFFLWQQSKRQASQFSRIAAHPLRPHANRTLGTCITI